MSVCHVWLCRGRPADWQQNIRTTASFLILFVIGLETIGLRYRLHMRRTVTPSLMCGCARYHGIACDQHNRRRRRRSQRSPRPVVESRYLFGPPVFDGASLLFPRGEPKASLLHRSFFCSAWALRKNRWRILRHFRPIYWSWDNTVCDLTLTRAILSKDDFCLNLKTLVFSYWSCSKTAEASSILRRRSPRRSYFKSKRLSLDAMKAMKWQLNEGRLPGQQEWKRRQRNIYKLPTYIQLIQG